MRIGAGNLKAEDSPISRRGFVGELAGISIVLAIPVGAVISTARPIANPPSPASRAKRSPDPAETQRKIAAETQRKIAKAARKPAKSPEKKRARAARKREREERAQTREQRRSDRARHREQKTTN